MDQPEQTSFPQSSQRKKVDEAWKEQVEKERKVSQPEHPAGQVPPLRRGAPPSDFGSFLSSLSMQAMVFLGELPQPVTGKKEEDLEQARTFIDLLGMLQEKTKGNLSKEEASLLEEFLYELRIRYVSKTKQGGTT